MTAILNTEFGQLGFKPMGNGAEMAVLPVKWN
jgi:hypothetical protein